MIVPYQGAPIDRLCHHDYNSLRFGVVANAQFAPVTVDTPRPAAQEAAYHAEKEVYWLK